MPHLRGLRGKVSRLSALGEERLDYGGAVSG